MKERLNRLRERWPWLDHTVRAYGRYSADAGDRLAAGVTYFGFLSVFPLIALAFSVLGYVLAGDAQAQADFVKTLQGNLPGLIGGKSGIDVNQIVRAKAGAGVVGLIGLLFAGLGWVDALREAIRTMWHQNVLAGNVVVKKVRDIAILAGLGIAVGLSLLVTALVAGATTFLLRHLGINDSVAAKVVVALLGLALVIVTDTVLFLYLFTGLPRLRTPLRRVLRGAVLAAVLFEILKLVGSFYIKRTTHNPVYGTVAVAVGLLVWINLVSRILLLCAAWVVTAAGDSDVEPSGTASKQAAREAGLPEQFADSATDGDSDGDGAPMLTEDGAPAPLRAAVQGRADGSVYPAPTATSARTGSAGQPDPDPPDPPGLGQKAAGAALAIWLRRRSRR